MRWLVITALLAGCSGPHTVRAGLDQAPPPFNPAEAAGEIERGCGLVPGSLLHVTSGGDIEVQPVVNAELSYPRFSCVMAAIREANLEERGLGLILTGEYAAR
ncbi:hypothetical protein [Brevundimonas sp.]|uniref:hypothetical protein n=1 Tax=Brevundimonas sp. TaxID=1871086 RepID=UPI0035AEEA2F